MGCILIHIEICMCVHYSGENELNENNKPTTGNKTNSYCYENNWPKTGNKTNSFCYSTVYMCINCYSILVYGSTTKGDVVERCESILVHGSTTKGDVVKRSS